MFDNMPRIATMNNPKFSRRRECPVSVYLVEIASDPSGGAKSPFGERIEQHTARVVIYMNLMPMAPIASPEAPLPPKAGVGAREGSRKVVSSVDKEA